MRNFLNDLLPTIDPSSCSKTGAICSSHLASIANTINPLISITNLQNPVAPLSDSVARVTGYEPCSRFADMFVCATGLPKKNVGNPPDGPQSAAIASWIDEMDKLAASHQVLSCMLQMLCNCKPLITVYVNNNSGYYGKVLFVKTNSNGHDEFDMVFNLSAINNRSFALTDEYILVAYNKTFNIDLTKGNSNQSSTGYFPTPPSVHYEIGEVVHELGHVLDRLYYKSYFPGTYANNYVVWNTSQVHAYMWQSFYYMEFYVIGNSATPSLKIPRFSPTSQYEYLNIPIPVTCSSIENKLDQHGP